MTPYHVELGFHPLLEEEGGGALCLACMEYVAHTPAEREHHRFMGGCPNTLADSVAYQRWLRS